MRCQIRQFSRTKSGSAHNVTRYLPQTALVVLTGTNQNKRPEIESVSEVKSVLILAMVTHSTKSGLNSNS